MSGDAFIVGAIVLLNVVGFILSSFAFYRTHYYVFILLGLGLYLLPLSADVVGARIAGPTRNRAMIEWRTPSAGINQQATWKNSIALGYLNAEYIIEAALPIVAIWVLFRKLETPEAGKAKKGKGASL